ncbi:hypothetical protein H4R33_003943 [Dimargaris cristalligena]|nr:hypothetical protein H4R33_003943 [Dimargaris cristalligena]
MARFLSPIALFALVFAVSAVTAQNPAEAQETLHRRGFFSHHKKAIFGTTVGGITAGGVGALAGGLIGNHYDKKSRK